MSTTDANAVSPERMRRISITIEVEIPESEFADLAEEALATGRDLRQLITARYGGARRARTAQAGSAGKSGVNVSDYRHLFNQAPEGRKPYRGSGRPPQWLLDRIQQESGATEG